mmetsp:Transcript_70036/g.226592  ORF Transcript_70036/g.226592 Transcript_70036/m.226592 type:complete len:216 (-) Transcript_70036:281-928(-)
MSCESTAVVQVGGAVAVASTWPPGQDSSDAAASAAGEAAAAVASGIASWSAAHNCSATRAAISWSSVTLASGSSRRRRTAASGAEAPWHSGSRRTARGSSGSSARTSPSPLGPAPGPAVRPARASAALARGPLSPWSSPATPSSSSFSACCCTSALPRLTCSSQTAWTPRSMSSIHCRRVCPRSSTCRRVSSSKRTNCFSQNSFTSLASPGTVPL